jgi:hypothetical protein
MQVSTTRHGPPITKNKPFAWSYSKLRNYETCPKRHLHVDILKDFREGESEALLWGNRVHKYLAESLAKRIPPHPDVAEYTPWLEKILAGGGDILVEQQLAIKEDFSPCEWFSKQAWFRAIADVIQLKGAVGVVRDFKTGKIVEDSVQLMLTAACMFSHYPQLQVVRSQFIWLAENADTTLDIKREELPTMWSNLWSRIEELKHAHVSGSFPPTPNRLCRRWCPVVVCPHHGQSHGG